jgi:hypothetical protein
MRIVQDQRVHGEQLEVWCKPGAAGSVAHFEIVTLHTLGDVVFYRGRLYVHSKDLRDDCLGLAHDAEGHPGRDRLCHRLSVSMRVGWPNVDREAAIWIASCTECQIDKTRVQHNHLLSGVSSPSIPTFPDHTWHLDLCGPFNGTTLIVVVDAFTHFMWIVSSRGGDSAQCIDALRRITLGVGHWPLILRVDDAKALNSTSFRALAASKQCTVLESPAYAQWTNGLAETRMHQIKMMMRAMGKQGAKGIIDGGASEDDIQGACVGLAELHNHSLCRTLACSPAQVRYGNVKPPQLEVVSGAFAYLPRPINWPPEAPLYTNMLCALQSVAMFTLSFAKLKDAAEKDAKRLLPPVYKKGDMVIQSLPLSLSSTTPSFRGPFRVLGPAAGSSWYNITDLENYDEGTFPFSVHVSALRRFNASRATESQLLARRLSDEAGIVLAITDHRAPIEPGREAEFLVTWDGCTEAVFTPGSLLTRLDLFKEYTTKHALSPGTFGLTEHWKPHPAATRDRSLRHKPAKPTAAQVPRHAAVQ